MPTPKPLSVLALDLEGTVITTGGTPRPCLAGFLSEAAVLCDQIMLYTDLSPARARQIAVGLVNRGHAPAWFGTLDCLQQIGPTKDLNRLPGGAGRAVLIDDDHRVVHRHQEDRWIRIRTLVDPFPETDEALVLALNRLRSLAR